MPTAAGTYVGALPWKYAPAGVRESTLIASPEKFGCYKGYALEPYQRRIECWVDARRISH